MFRTVVRPCVVWLSGTRRLTFVLWALLSNQVECYQSYSKFDPYASPNYFDRQMVSHSPVQIVPLCRGPLANAYDRSREMGFKLNQPHVNNINMGRLLQGNVGMPKDILTGHGMLRNEASGEVESLMRTFGSLPQTSYFSNACASLGPARIELGPHKRTSYLCDNQRTTPNDFQQYEPAHGIGLKYGFGHSSASHSDKEKSSGFMGDLRDTVRSMESTDKYGPLGMPIGQLGNGKSKLTHKSDEMFRAQEYDPVTTKRSHDTNQIKEKQFIRSEENIDKSPFKELEGFTVEFNANEAIPKQNRKPNKIQKYAKKGDIKSVSRLITFEDLKRQEKEEEMERRNKVKMVKDVKFKNQRADKYHASRTNPAESNVFKIARLNDLIEKERLMSLKNGAQETSTEKNFEKISYGESLNGGQNIESENFKNQATDLAIQQYEPITHQSMSNQESMGEFPITETNTGRPQFLQPIMSLSTGHELPHIARETTSYKPDDASLNTYYKQDPVDQILRDLSRTGAPKADHMDFLETWGTRNEPQPRQNQQYSPTNAAMPIVVMNRNIPPEPQPSKTTVSVLKMKVSQEEPLFRQAEKVVNLLREDSNERPTRVKMESDMEEDDIQDSATESNLITNDQFRSNNQDQRRDNRQGQLSDLHYPLIFQRGKSFEENQKSSRRVNPSSEEHKLNGHGAQQQSHRKNNYGEFKYQVTSSTIPKAHLTQGDTEIQGLLDVSKTLGPLKGMGQEIVENRNSQHQNNVRMDSEQRVSNIIAKQHVQDIVSKLKKHEQRAKQRGTKEECCTRLTTCATNKLKPNRTPKTRSDTKHKHPGDSRGSQLQDQMTYNSRTSSELKRKSKLKNKEVKVESIGNVIEDNLVPVNEMHEKLPSIRYTTQADLIDISFISEKENVKNHLEKVMKMVNDLKTKSVTESKKVGLQGTQRKTHELKTEKTVEELKNALHRLKGNLAVNRKQTDFVKKSDQTVMTKSTDYELRNKLLSNIKKLREAMVHKSSNIELEENNDEQDEKDEENLQGNDNTDDNKEAKRNMVEDESGIHDHNKSKIDEHAFRKKHAKIKNRKKKKKHDTKFRRMN